MAVEAYSGMRDKRHNIRVREMEIDDLAKVFHLGEKLLRQKKRRISTEHGTSMGLPMYLTMNLAAELYLDFLNSLRA